MPTIHVYDSTEEMFEELRKDQEAADEAAKTHHLKVEDFEHGDFFASVRPDHGCVVFGEVWTRCEKYPADTRVIRASRKRGYLYGHCYSTECVEGEIGSTHITRVSAKISREVFKRAKANGWRHLQPSD